MDEKTEAAMPPEAEQNASETLQEEQLNEISGGSGSGSTEPVPVIRLNHNQNVAD